MRYMVELHTETDVFKNDRHSEEAPARRMYERIKLEGPVRQRRLWKSQTGHGRWQLMESESTNV